jgi:hypothetical protein
MNQKYTFLWALIVTFVIFNIGIFFGYQLEKSRSNTINTLYAETDLNILDQRIQTDAFDSLGLNCSLAVAENIKFADKIYADALKIQKYENANQLTATVELQHKKYDLLRTLFWLNSINIKKKCNSDYHNVVYLYKYNNPTLEQVAKQRTFSNLLEELKNEKGDKIMLIPMAGDNNLSSVNLLLDKYGVKQEELPVILIDERTKIVNLNNKSEIEAYLK